MINLLNLKTPGVYIQEKDAFPPSVVGVETGVPAFVGVTKSGPTFKPTKIKKIEDYEAIFGAEKNISIKVALDTSNGVESIVITPEQWLYLSVRLFFENGGRLCYIVSVGSNINGDFTGTNVGKALLQLESETEPFTVLAPDVCSSSIVSPGPIYEALIAHSALSDDIRPRRMALLDIQGAGDPAAVVDDLITNFRNAIGINDLEHAAAYFPWLRTNLEINNSYVNLDLKRGSRKIELTELGVDASHAKQMEAFKLDMQARALDFDLAAMNTDFQNNILNGAGQDTDDAHKAIDDLIIAFRAQAWSFNNALLTASEQAQEVKGKLLAADSVHSYYIDPLKTQGQILTNIEAANDALQVNPAVAINAQNSAAFKKVFLDLMSFFQRFNLEIETRLAGLDGLIAGSSAAYSNIKTAIAREGVTIPPSGAIAGLYNDNDNKRGIWKAPANASLRRVIAPSIKINDRDQRELNVDSNTGKSINVIRSFSGLSPAVVWGARTLKGNSNDWRYVNVRRLFNYVEESARRFARQFVFEANDINTWISVRVAIERFLEGLRLQGGLSGATPQEAYQVLVGVPDTMNEQDVLEGRMIVTIKMNPPRPAEFIVLTFTQIVQPPASN